MRVPARLLICGLAAGLLCASLAAQRGEKAPVLVPADQAQSSPPPAPAAPAQEGPRVVTLPPPDLGEAQADPKAPRPMQPVGPPPFSSDRALLEVDGVPIRAAELNELVLYFQGWRPGSADILLRDAVAALIPRAAVQARYPDALDGMRSKVEQARAALAAGGDWATVVRDYSDDDEAPSPDGSYQLKRGRAVQPFDRLCHSGGMNELSQPFLTQYGYHVLQITGYEQALEPQDDVSTVRHVLIMFPFQGDARAEIHELAQAAKIRVLEPGLRNILPPDYRDQVLP